MRYIFKFPDIGEGLDEGTIVEWYVQKGQEIKAGDALVKMETDKVVTDIPSPKSGTVAAVFGKIGETIHVGAPLVEIDIAGVEGQDAVIENKKTEATESVAEEGAGVVGTLEVAGNAAYLPAGNEGLENSTEVKTKKKVLATPVARALARDYGIDINLVGGSGPGGRVIKDDVQQYFEKKGSKNLQSSTVQTMQVDQLVEVETMTQLRKTIAKNMIVSKHNAAHMTVFEETEISELIRLREKFKARYADQNVKLTYLAFIVKAVALALKKHKALNSEMDLERGTITYKKYYNIGFAVDTPDGLFVPVIRNADKLSVYEIAHAISDLSTKARDKKLKIDEMRDGTFTITNYGSIGGLYAVPVINYPQAAILGVGRLDKKPIVKNDAIAVGNMLPLSLSVDHRIVDGGEVTRFINRVMEYLADPALLIMD